MGEVETLKVIQAEQHAILQFLHQKLEFALAVYSYSIGQGL